MASDETGLVLSHRLDSNHPQLLFQDDSNSGFGCNPPTQRPGSGPDRPATGTTSNNNGKATRELTGFIDHQHRYYQTQGTTEFRQSMYNPGPVHHRGLQNWHGGNGRASDSPSGDGDGSDGNDDADDVEGLVNSSDNKNNNSSNTSGHSSEKEGNAKLNHLSSFGSSREVVKVGSVVPSRNDLNDVRPSSSENRQQGQVGQYQNAVALVDRDGELYYSQYLHGVEGSGAGLKDVMVENGCGFSGRKDVPYSVESGDSLRAILSDPLTGALMDDAMILPCGHSFGSGGMQHVMKMKACYTCSHPVSEGSVASNLCKKTYPSMLCGLLLRHFVGRKRCKFIMHLKEDERDQSRTGVMVVIQCSWMHQEAEVFSFHFLWLTALLSRATRGRQSVLLVVRL